MLPVNNPGQWYDPGPLGTLGVGTGFCMGINTTYPDKKILMVNGDGAFGLNGIEFDTFVRHNMPVVSRHRQRPPVGPDHRRPVRAYGRERVVADASWRDNARYDKVVEALGGHGEFVTEAKDIRRRHRARLRLRQAGLRERDHGPDASGRRRRLRVPVGVRSEVSGVQ